MTTCQLITGDAMTELARLPDASIQLCVTSPPYFGLRSYMPAGHPDKAREVGGEQTPDAYIARLVEVFHEVRRVLRDDGTLWLNVGDSYAGAGGHTAQGVTSQRKGRANVDAQNTVKGFQPRVTGDIKQKDLIGVPWALAFALRADGWWLRQDIIWAKPAPMPESVTDRCTRSHEYLFMFSKRERYYYDAAAIAEPAASDWTTAGGSLLNKTGWHTAARGHDTARNKLREYDQTQASTRNKRSVWTVQNQPYPGAHYAVMPPKLVEPCVLAGSSSQACEQCGAPYARVVGKVFKGDGNPIPYEDRPRVGSKMAMSGRILAHWKAANPDSHEWRPTCTHDNAGTGACTVLDPFSGVATTGAVALAHGRSYIGIDLDARNQALATQRIGPLLCAISEREEVAI